MSPDLAIRAAHRAAPVAEARPRLLIAGATGVTGNAVLRRLVGMQRACHTQVLATSPFVPGMRHVSAWVVPASAPGADIFAGWPVPRADIAIVMFDPPRMFHGREKALWTPTPGQLIALGTWLQSCGVHTLAIVLPHAQGSLPEALKHGLANLEEHSLAALGIPRVLIVRTASKPGRTAQDHALKAIAAWMLSVTSYMVPRSEQPVRAAKVAEFVDIALQLLPEGIHVVAPQLVWQAAQGDTAGMRHVLDQLIAPRPGAAARSNTRATAD